MAIVISNTVQKYAQRSFQRDSRGHSTFEDYLAHLADPRTSASLPIKLDTSHPISHYFISSSHNTYLSGNQLWSRSTAEAYKDVLKRACRCIEIDIWDGDSPSSSDAEGQERGRDLDVSRLTGMIRKGIGRLRSRSNGDRAKSDQATTDSPADDVMMPTPWRTQSGRDEPVVYHGYTATTQMPFRDVCEVVRKYAFRTSDLPVIVSLELHCHQASQAVIVEHIETYWKEFLFPIPTDFSDSTPLPSLESLRKKILVKVKYVAPEKAKAKAKNPDSAQDSDQDSADDDPRAAAKKNTIIAKLSNLGIFTRAFHFHDFDQAEASIPTHVFSLSEGKLLTACKEQPGKLFNHNLRYLMRAYPKGTRLQSSNLDPAPFWRFGLQMVALNFQKLNAAMMLQHAQFEDTGGWVLKPKGYLPVNGVQTGPERVSLDVSITLLAGQGLGPRHDTPKVYVKSELHVESEAEAKDSQIPNGGQAKEGEYKHHSVVRHSRDPDFHAEEVVFKGVRHVVPELSFIRFKVMDDALAQKDPLLGWACYRVDRIPHGLLLVQLLGDDSMPSGGRILLDVQVVNKPEVSR